MGNFSKASGTVTKVPARAKVSVNYLAWEWGLMAACQSTYGTNCRTTAIITSHPTMKVCWKAMDSLTRLKAVTSGGFYQSPRRTIMVAPAGVMEELATERKKEDIIEYTIVITINDLQFKNKL